MRRNFGSVRLSRIPQVIGSCASDTARLLAYVNSATELLVLAGGETGWFGTWDKMAFHVACTSPYLITPINVARVINLDVCNMPIKIQNGFFEMMENGIGYQERANSSCPGNGCAITQAFDRGMQPFLTDFVAGNFIRAYPSNIADVGKRLFFAGTDTNGLPVSSLDNGSVVPGVFLTLEMPYAQTAVTFNTVTNVTKDQTIGLVALYQVDASANATLLANYDPGTQYPAYRKYFINALPKNCCGSPTVGLVTLQAMCKREFIPYTNDMDELLISNIEALTAACQSIRFSEMDSPTASQKQGQFMASAIKILTNELAHYFGLERPAVVFSAMGNRSADREYSGLGYLT